MFVGRKKELEVLEEKYRTNKLELGVIYGARRIGKTCLVNEFIKGKRSISFLASDTSEYDNLVLFSQTLNRFLNLPENYVYPSFKDIFDALIYEAKKETLVLFIDELPFLAKTYPPIVNLLQGLINNNQDINIKILLSGSDFSFMEELLKDKSKPLYQRITFQIKLDYLNFSEAVTMLNGLDHETIINYLAILGPHPYYLSMIELDKDFEHNIKFLLFSKFGTLLSAPYLTLPLSWGNSGMYIAIYKALSNKINKLSDIASHLNMLPNQLSTYIKRLLDAEIIVKKEMFNSGQKNNYYEIKDRLLRFYYKFIYPNIDAISQDLGEAIYQRYKEQIDHHIYHGFEDVVIDYLDEQNRLNKLDSIYAPFKSLNIDNSILGRSIQIDAISESLLDKNKLIVVEDKYRNKHTSLEALNHLIESASIFTKYNNKQYYLFSKIGFTDDIKKMSNENIHLFTLDDMFIWISM